MIISQTSRDKPTSNTFSPSENAGTTTENDNPCFSNTELVAKRGTKEIEKDNRGGCLFVSG